MQQHLDNFLIQIELREKVEEWHQQWSILDYEMQNKLVYEMLKHMPRKSDGHMDLQFLGQKVCKIAFQVLVGIGNHRYMRLADHANNGFLAPPVDGRRAKGPSPEVHPHRQSADLSQFANPLRDVLRSVAEHA